MVFQRDDGRVHGSTSPVAVENTKGTAVLWGTLWWVAVNISSWSTQVPRDFEQVRRANEHSHIASQKVPSSYASNKNTIFINIHYSSQQGGVFFEEIDEINTLQGNISQTSTSKIRASHIP